MEGLIYRLPPYIASPYLLSAEDIQEKLDWGLLDLQVPEMWKLTEGEGIKIGVCDTGAPNHPDIGELAFAHNLTRSPTALDRQRPAEITMLSELLAVKPEAHKVLLYLPCSVKLET